MTFLASRAGHCEQPRLAQGQLRLLGTAQVDIPVDVGDAILLGFPFLWGAVDADVENSASTEGRERRLYGGGFGDSLRIALGLRVWIFL